MFGIGTYFVLHCLCSSFCACLAFCILCLCKHSFFFFVFTDQNGGNVQQAASYTPKRAFNNHYQQFMLKVAFQRFVRGREWDDIVMDLQPYFETIVETSKPLPQVLVLLYCTLVCTHNLFVLLLFEVFEGRSKSCFTIPEMVQICWHLQHSSRREISCRIFGKWGRHEYWRRGTATRHGMLFLFFLLNRFLHVTFKATEVPGVTNNKGIRWLSLLLTDGYSCCRL